MSETRKYHIYIRRHNEDFSLGSNVCPSKRNSEREERQIELEINVFTGHVKITKQHYEKNDPRPSERDSL